MPSVPTLPPNDPASPFLAIRRILYLRGPNIWSRRPCLEAWVDLGPWEDFSSEMIPGFNERYKAWLPSVIEHRCSEGVRGGFFQRLDRGTYLAHILEHTTLELQTLAGCDLGFGRARGMSERGVYKVAVRYEEESVVHACLLAARSLLQACIYDLPFSVADEIARLHDLADRRCLGPSTKAILAVADKRNIPYRRLNTGSLVVLGQGKLQRRIWTAESDRTGAIAESIAQDKALTKRLLSAVGVPVPEGREVSGPEDAVEAASEIEHAVVVKPLDANHGRGVIPNLVLPDAIRNAYHVAAKEGSGVLVERYVPGSEHRLLVVGDRFVAASRGEPVTVAGDGVRTIRRLVEEVVNRDPRRGEDEIQPLSPIELDDGLLMILATQGLDLDSIPAAGKPVLVKRHDNLSNDVTDLVHPTVAENAILAAKTVGLDIAGIDIVALDISCPLEDQNGAVVEVNAGPGLIMHLKPLVGQPRPVGEAILESMFPQPGDARVPLFCVSGTGPIERVSHAIYYFLQSLSLRTGLVSRTGTHFDQRSLSTQPSDHARRTRDLLLHPNLDAAVVEAPADSILRDGLGTDKCLLAVIVRVETESQLGGEFDLYDEDRVFSVFRTAVDVVLPEGVVVLNGEDPMCIRMKGLFQGNVVLFARSPNSPALQEHLNHGGSATYLDHNQVVYFDGTTKRRHVCPVSFPTSVKPDRMEDFLASISAIASFSPASLDAERITTLSRKLLFSLS